MRLEVQHLQVSRGGRPIVRDVSFTLAEGQWMMLAGMNGAGKSTLLRAVSCAIPSTGGLTLDGQPLRDMKPTARALKMGMLEAGSAVTYGYTVEQLVSMGRYAHRGGILGRGDPQGEAAVRDALTLTGLWDMRQHSMLTLSSGERQRAFLAQVLCQQPALLLLDEPASHLDLTYTRQLYELVDQWRQEPGRAVISVVHDLSAARRYGTHALLMKDGQALSQGTCTDTLTDAHLADAWDMDVAGWMRELARVWD